jgi:hypothetical protein
MYRAHTHTRTYTRAHTHTYRNAGCRCSGMRAVDVAYIIWPISDGWSYVSAVCAHKHTRTYTRARTHTHIHTDYIDCSFFLFRLSLSRTNMHTRHKSLGLSVGWRKLDAKDASRRLKPQRFFIHHTSGWPIPADDTERLFETLLTDQNWTIWVCADEAERSETQFRLKKGGAYFGKPEKRPKMTENLKRGLIKHGLVTDDMLRLARENNE